MNRRGFLKLIGVGAAAVVAPQLVEEERRFWFFDRNPIARAEGRGARQEFIVYDEMSFIEPYQGMDWQEIDQNTRSQFRQWVEAKESYATAFTDWLPKTRDPYDQITITTGQSYNPFVRGAMTFNSSQSFDLKIAKPRGLGSSWERWERRISTYRDDDA